MILPTLTFSTTGTLNAGLTTAYSNIWEDPNIRTFTVASQQQYNRDTSHSRRPIRLLDLHQQNTFVWWMLVHTHKDIIILRKVICQTQASLALRFGIFLQRLIKFYLEFGFVLCTDMNLCVKNAQGYVNRLMYVDKVVFFKQIWWEYVESNTLLPSCYNCTVVLSLLD